MIIGLTLTLVIVIFIALYWVAEPGRQEAASERQKAEAVERGAELYIPQEEGSFRVEVSLNGFNNTPGEFRLEVEEGQEVEITFVYGDYDLPVNNPHIIAIPDLGITPFILDQNNPEFTVSFTAPKVGEVTLFSFMCTQIACAGHNNLLGGTIVIQPTPQTTLPAAATGELYAGNCAACHGVNRQGISGLAPSLTPESLTALNYTEIRDIILNGSSNTAMPPFKGTLSQTEIEALVQFLKDTSP